MITKDTSLVGVFGGTAYDLIKLFEAKGPADADKERAARLAPLFIKWGKIFILRADLAWCQGPVHECDWLRFTGTAQPEWNNFAGIGVTGPAGVGNRFATEELGVIAQFAHLAWYVTPVHVNSYCNQKYDPRHFGTHRYNGNTSMDRLAGSWAVPGRYPQPDGSWITYGGQIAKIANKIFPSVDPNEDTWWTRLREYLKIRTKYDWQYIAIHHTVSGQFWTTMEMIKRWHINRVPPFIREGYHFGVDGRGNVEKGRPYTMHGAHVKGWNTRAIGVAIYGDFRTDVMTPEQKESTYKLCSEIQKRFGMGTSKFLGHNEFPDRATSCPVIDMDWFRNGYLDWLQKL